MDQRLVRDGFIEGRSAEALALYLFLVTVGDAQGLSYYSDQALCRTLGFSPVTLGQARRELEDAGLIAYQRPLYQVLSLGCKPVPTIPAVRNSGARTFAANNTQQQIISRLVAQIGKLR